MDNTLGYIHSFIPDCGEKRWNADTVHPWGMIFLVISDTFRLMINRQKSTESSASGSVSNGQHVVYEAICGKTGGSDAVFLHML